VEALAMKRSSAPDADTRPVVQPGIERIDEPRLGCGHFRLAATGQPLDLEPKPTVFAAIDPPGRGIPTRMLIKGLSNEVAHGDSFLESAKNTAGEGGG